MLIIITNYNTICSKLGVGGFLTWQAGPSSLLHDPWNILEKRDTHHITSLYTWSRQFWFMIHLKVASNIDVLHIFQYIEREGWSIWYE